MKSHAVEFTSFINLSLFDPDYAGVPIIEDVIDTAFDFMYFLPENIILPEIDFENDGDIYLEWYGSKDKHFSVIVSSGFISYPQSNGYANCKFTKDTLGIPDEIITMIKDVYAL